MRTLRHAFAAMALMLAWSTQADGATLPELAGRTEHGTPVDLTADKGKVVLLFFWSTECAVCLDLLPEMRRNLKGWRGKDFVIIAVNQDRSIANLMAYEQVLDQVAPANPQMQIVWRPDPAYHDSFGSLPMRTPTTMVVDRDGNVVQRVTGRAAPEVWDQIADLVLNCNTCQ